MAVAPFAVLAAGKIRTDEEEQKRIESGEGGRSVFGDWKRTEEQRTICKGIEKVAKEVGAKHITSGAFTPSSKFPLSIFHFSNLCCV